MLRFQVVVTISIFLCKSCGVSSASEQDDNDNTLRLVQALFRHGDRTNDARSTYPTDPYINETYYPYGIGELTNKGRQTEYNLGRALRQRYKDFLEELYTPDVLYAYTTDMSRTKMSLQLVLAGLYPPKRTELEWDADLNWQPIPYDYAPFEKNKLLTMPFAFCPNYIKHYVKYLNSPEGLEIQKKYTGLFEYLTEHTGLKVSSTFQADIIYFALRAEQDWGFKLPEWTDKIYPEELEKAAIEQYFVFSATTSLKQLSGGQPDYVIRRELLITIYGFFWGKVGDKIKTVHSFTGEIPKGILVKEMMNNMKQKANNKSFPPNRKLFLYSGHEISVAYAMNALEVYFPHVPPYGACLLVELHEINEVYGVKIYYQDYKQDEPQPLKIPTCEHFCPLQEFDRILQKNLPTGADPCNLLA